MLALRDAQARVLALASIVASEKLPLAAAINRYASADLTAQRTQPARHLSAMDGYAIRFEDADGPWTVIGESAAGAPFRNIVMSGEAVRIFTGAAVPEGADTVIIQENVVRQGDVLMLMGDVPRSKGANIRYAGSDFVQGDLIAPAGTRLRHAHIGLLALAGHTHIPVARQIKVAMLSTGDELVPLGAPLDDDHIPNSNAPMLAALCADLPATIIDLGIAPDNLTALTTAITSAHEADILVTIGGASVGDHDLVRPALLAAGAQIDFWKVAMRPGKPLMAGILDKQFILGLPGNPVSAYVTALLFLKPLIAALSGARDALPKPISMTVGTPLPANGNRTDHIRARAENGLIIPLSSQDSAGLAALAKTDFLIVRAPNAPPAAKGDQVLVIAA